MYLDIKVAVILDEFSFNSFKDEVMSLIGDNQSVDVSELFRKHYKLSQEVIKNATNPLLNKMEDKTGYLKV